MMHAKGRRPNIIPSKPIPAAIATVNQRISVLDMALEELWNQLGPLVSAEIIEEFPPDTGIDDALVNLSVAEAMDGTESENGIIRNTLAGQISSLTNPLDLAIKKVRFISNHLDL